MEFSWFFFGSVSTAYQSSLWLWKWSPSPEMGPDKEKAADRTNECVWASECLGIQKHPSFMCAANTCDLKSACLWMRKIWNITGTEINSLFTLSHQGPFSLSLSRTWDPTIKQGSLLAMNGRLGLGDDDPWLLSSVDGFSKLRSWSCFPLVSKS